MKKVAWDEEKYFSDLKREVDKEYGVAGEARARGLDPSLKVEIPLAMTMAEKSVGLITTIYPDLPIKEISERMLELEKEFGQLDTMVSFSIAREIAEEKFCKFKDKLEAIDCGIRVGFAYITLGVVSSPIEGYTGITLGKTREGEDYFIANFSGPIRSAGTTATCLVLMLIDYLREHFGYAKYDPDESEVKRYITENLDYHERVTNLQYLPTEEEMEFLAKNLPIQISGDPTEHREVSNYKDLPRVSTNYIRGGMCLTFSEGLAQKAGKGVGRLASPKKHGLKCSGWDFLNEYLEIHKRREGGSKDVVATYIKDLVAGRPVYGHPSASGGFRFRYGRSRSAGFSAVSIHPATMGITNGFLSQGTQLKIEKPTKGCIITSCDEIDGPIVKLTDGSVKKIKDFEEARKIYKDVEEIIYLGDILFPLGDVIDRNSVLLKSGYVEEWWKLELEEKLGKKIDFDFRNVSFEKAIEFSRDYSVALHSNYIFYWREVEKENFLNMLSWMGKGFWRGGKIVLPWESSVREKFSDGKRALELAGVEHKVFLDNIIIEEDAKGFLFNLGVDYKDLKEESLKDLFNKFFEGENFNLDKGNLNSRSQEFRVLPNSQFAPRNNLSAGVSFVTQSELLAPPTLSESRGNSKREHENVLKVINKVCRFEVKDKSGTFIGTRMGRPEKAKLRKLTGSPNIIFPVSEQGGRFRSVQEAVSVGFINSDWPIFICKCGNETIYSICEKCGGKTEKRYYCRTCKKVLSKVCESHKESCFSYSRRKIDAKHFFDVAKIFLNYGNYEIPILIKGVRGTSSEGHDFENLAKGILRAKFNLCVNKDGTVRYDGTEIPLTHFKPLEIRTSVEKLKEIGYEQDVYGSPLEKDEQVLELKPHDIILSSCPETLDEKGDDVFFNIANFVDEELERFYKMPRHYNLKSKEDLVGHLVVCMAPHNCAGVIGRVIGFSKMQGLVASPYMHAAMRRDCVHPDTNFVYLKEGVVRNERIGDFTEGLIKEGRKREIIDDFGTERIECDEDLYAFGVDVRTKKLKKKRIKYFIKGKTPEKWVKIKTASGREQIMTPRHKFIYLNEKNKFKVKSASEIKRGDRIGVLKNFKLENKIAKIFLPKVLSECLPTDKLREIRIVGAGDFFKKIFKKNKTAREIVGIGGFRNSCDWYKLIPLLDVKKLVEGGVINWGELPEGAKIRSVFNNKEWGFDLEISKELMWILGCYSAEGYSRQTKTVSQVCFRIIDESQKTKLVNCIGNVFGLGVCFGEEKTKITLCNKLIYYLFKFVFNCGEGAYEKRVPDIVYNVSEEFAIEYLSAYFDGDGSIVNQERKRFIIFYSVSRGLLDGISLLCARFGLFGKFYRTKERLPGKKVLERYSYLGKEPKKHILNHLTYTGNDFYILGKILRPVSEKKFSRIKNIQEKVCRDRIKFDKKYFDLDGEGDIVVDFVSEVEFVRLNESSYCFEVEWDSEEDKNVLWGEQIINARCDGDEAAVMLLMDVLLNFSRKFLPSHRGGTQDAPLVLNARIRAGEVDDQILAFELCDEYPLELYRLAEEGKHSGEVKIEMVKTRLKNGESPFVCAGWTHNTNNINLGVLNGAYKILPTMKEKVGGQMELVGKIRAVDTEDVARLVIERHLIRDIRGNLRKFAQQQFRCVKCNEKFRRPPLIGVCTKCGGKIIFTISEGSIKKYLEPAMDLAVNYNISSYTKEGMELTKMYIESIFGKDSEKQEDLKKWF